MSGMLITTLPQADLHARFCAFSEKLNPCAPSGFFSNVFSLLSSNVIENSEDFWNKFPKQITSLLELLQQYEKKTDTDTFDSKIRLCSLVKRISGFIETLLLHRKNLQKLEFKEALGIYEVANKLKTHNPFYDELWDRLPLEHRQFVQSLSSWSEDLSVILDPNARLRIDEDRNRPVQGQEMIEGGNKQLYKISSLTYREGTGHLDYALANQPKYILSQTTEPFTEGVEIIPEIVALNLLTCKNQLNYPQMGRIAEIFDIASYGQGTHESSVDYIVSGKKRKLLEVFKCYKSGLYDALGLPAHMPAAIDTQGSWTIWPKAEPRHLSNQNITDQTLTDIHRHLHLEKLWKIDVMNGYSETNEFKDINGHAVLSGAQQIPVFMKNGEDIQTRHRLILTRLSLTEEQTKKWNELEAASQEEIALHNRKAAWIQKYLNDEILSIDDFAKMSPKALLLLRGLDQNTDKDCTPHHVSFVHFTDIVDEMIPIGSTENKSVDANFTFDIDSEQSYKEILPKVREALNFISETDNIESYKENLHKLMALYVIKNMPKKSTWEEQVNSMIEFGMTTGKALSKIYLNALPEDCRRYFEIMFEDEFLERLQEISSPIHGQIDLEHQLTLLKLALEAKGCNKKELDKALQSVLHDAMVDKSRNLFVDNMRKHISTFGITPTTPASQA